MVLPRLITRLGQSYSFNFAGVGTPGKYTESFTATRTEYVCPMNEDTALAASLLALKVPISARPWLGSLVLYADILADFHGMILEFIPLAYPWVVFV